MTFGTLFWVQFIGTYPVNFLFQSLPGVFTSCVLFSDCFIRIILDKSFVRYMDHLYLFPLCSLCFNSFNGDF